ncbi:STAS domain-containing protein [Couchioplanes caeruleus]|uniref:STAS domain-containing protein n=1 Tax=Couchioplanes caeruleus TaxID=56438 RepID=UPI0020BF4808|nr:STAS domain-containing protein [Couchioplanes caeruleus]UQU62964.1 STAS domain-containing protein [Couchioplanes caeruleus]
MVHFQARTTAGPGRVVVTLTGECDLEGRDELTAVLLSAVGSAPVVVVDLAGVTFIDSSGIHGLVTAHRAALDAGRRLHVVHAAGTVATVLEITGVAGLLGDSSAAVPGTVAGEDTAHA